MVDVVTDSGRVDPSLSALRVGVHPYEVEDLTTNELLHLHGSCCCVVSGGGIVSEFCAGVELTIVTEEEVVILVSRSFPVAFDLVRTSPNELRIDLTANEDVSRVTLAVAAGTAIGSAVGVGIGEDEFTVETIGILHVLDHIFLAGVVGSIGHNVATTEVVGLVTPETRVVVLVVSSGHVVVRTGIVGSTNGNVGAVGRLELVVGVTALLLIEVEGAFTLSHNISEVRDGHERHCVAVSNSFNYSGSRGVVTLDFVAGLIGSHEHAGSNTLYRKLSAVNGSRGVERLGLSHAVSNVHFTVSTGHYDHVLLVSTRTLDASNVVCYSEGIGRSNCSSFSCVVLRGSRSTGSGLELQHVVVLRCEIVEVVHTVEERLRFARGVHHNKHALLTRIYLETLGRTDVSEFGVTGLGLFEADFRGTESSLTFEGEVAGTGSGSVSLEDVNVYAFDEVITHPLTCVVVRGVGRVLTVIRCTI